MHFRNCSMALHARTSKVACLRMRSFRSFQMTLGRMLSMIVCPLIVIPGCDSIRAKEEEDGADCSQCRDAAANHRYLVKICSDAALLAMSVWLFWDSIKKLGPKKKETIPWQVLDENGNTIGDKELVSKTWSKDFEKLYKTCRLLRLEEPEIENDSTLSKSST